MRDIKLFLAKNKIEYFENFDSSLISSIKLGLILKLVIFPKTTNEFEKILTYFYNNKIGYKVFGNLSNILVVNNLTMPVVVTNKMSENIEIKDKVVTVSAGVMLPKFCEKLRRYNLSGIEGLIGIPATIGGAIINNAGAYGYSISDRLVKIKVFYAGKIFYLMKNEIKFFYHHSNLYGFVILEATFLFEFKNEYDIINLSNNFNYLRGKTQPTGLSLGSVFRKVYDKSAGFYIERSGLKGFRVGGIVVSSKHSNFFINDKNGTVSDFLHLISIVKTCVENQFGVSLIPEIEKVGEFNETYSRLPYPLKI